MFSHCYTSSDRGLVRLLAGRVVRYLCETLFGCVCAGKLGAGARFVGM
nr:hypothetical protein [uncultured bacterium]